ncbi:4-hydroxy-tetrahydrodipicolinate synthase [Pseudomonas alcaligenes]|uniref:4-hydroxy-tetrahydrodipicolinate synthase n=1 Tax=Aquipseudomonas alcaligenes TaxID=43263 RepID=A0ABR7S5U2_AQUAC|nr:4-hydroxy-tetrahydrodipicolinate synthase [Pseudomonas alcaligenes]MBC9252382.1 4-hydroxy-tetrahydrodipicolinate synthase [Pseudomonas alcaligenes]
MSSFHGIWVALVTPFNNAGAVDFPALRGLVDHLLAGDVAGLVVCGTTGEAAALSQAEQLAVLDAVLELAPPEKVVMGLAGNNQAELLQLQREIVQRPIAGLLIPAPYYIRPSQDALVSFFHTLADASSVPVILYDIPYRTGVHLQLDTLRRIVAHERIVAIKDCGNNPENTLAMLSEGQVDVLTGEDGQIFNALCLGASGVISAAAHLYPERFVRLHRQVLAGQLEAARQSFFQLLPLIQTLFSEPNPAPVKTALAQQGLLCDALRAPMQASSAATATRLQALLQQLDGAPR